MARKEILIEEYTQTLNDLTSVFEQTYEWNDKFPTRRQDIYFSLNEELRFLNESTNPSDKELDHWETLLHDYHSGRRFPLPPRPPPTTLPHSLTLGGGG